MKRSIALFACGVAAASVSGLAAPHAVAEEGFVQIIHVQDNTCLHVNGASVTLEGSCGPKSAQRWDMPDKDGTIRLHDDHNVCLDSNAAGQVYARACNGGAYQSWWRSRTPLSSTWMLKDAATGRCLDGNKGAVYTSVCSKSNGYERWRFQN
ncbi:RICIN domain-containing protein [Actinomadura physcomitrii]|nr:ricin-type beta-trefoil lectin domain protein [Actinomadura physcomitrii]